MARRNLPLAAVAVVLAVAVLVLGGHAAQGATDLVASTATTVSTTTADGTTTGATTSAAADTTTPSTSSIPIADENDDGVRRVVVVGDSLVVGAAQELIETFEANDVEYRFIAESGTGLLTDQGVRATELETALEEFHPDVVVVESCCNYDGSYTQADGSVVTTDSDGLWEAWTTQAERMATLAEDHDAEVFFVITPRAIDEAWFSGLDDRIQNFNAVYRSLEVELIDWDAALYPDGSTTGLTALRHADGLHLSDAGDELVASATWTAIAGSFTDR